MAVDSFRYMSRLISRYCRLTKVEAEFPIPWSPLAQPLCESRFGLGTSGGLYHKGDGPPLDLERERQEPTWGDPTFRALPVEMDPGEVDVAHHHINKRDVVADMNILLPIQRFHELVNEGRTGDLASDAYSFMGYPGFPSNLTEWRQTYGPQVAERLVADGADCVLLTAA